ncbi:hypothetical protein B0H14DRAFT_2649699 [Mycena olivaceomarginata]|nr:hypothetical protein B0H14DRAFT_2649699 [Mycena olivaceomarginata]
MPPPPRSTDLVRETEQLRREANEWCACACVLQLDVPIRSNMHYAVLRTELEEFELKLDTNIALEEDGDEGDEPNNSHDNNSNSTEEALPLSPTVQLQDTTASIKCARSALVLALAYSFYMPSPIHTTILMPPPSANGAPPAAPSRAASTRRLHRRGPKLLPICLSFTWHEWMGIACNVITIWHAFMMICEESVALASKFEVKDQEFHNFKL